MISPENRLTKGKDFDYTHRTGRFFSGGSLRVKIAKNGLNKTRIGISVGLKFSLLATVRNKAKRLLREIAKKHLDEIKPGFDIIIMIKKEAVFPEYAKLEKDLSVILEKNRLNK